MSLESHTPSMRRLRPTWFAWLALASTLSCTREFTAPFPADATEIAPPIPYRAWWTMTEACARRSGNFDAVRWFTVPDGTLKADGEEYDGIWYHSTNRIVLTATSVGDGQIVRHEMLHAILQDGSHPLAAFVDLCGGVVAFGHGQHIPPASLAPGPGATSPILDVRDLIKSVAISTDSIAQGLPDSGWVSLTVTVVNPRSVPVWVRVQPRHPNQYAGATFGMAQLLSAYGSFYDRTDYSIDSLVPFAAGESKRRVFDQQLFRVNGLGDWRLTGLFNEDTIATKTVTVVP